ncbi:hypothetical protein FRC17_002799 [Serendipita sp. 399]|nr:hypothetical protein FRC17_002799 [Serendipita sp. 399]
MQEADLWCHIAVHPCQHSSPNKFELLKFSLEMAKRQKVLISNLSQSLLWNEQYEYDHNGTYVRPIAVNTATISGAYDVVVVTGIDNSSRMSRITLLPFQSPEKLTLVNRPGSRYGNLFTYVPQYASVKSLEVIDPTPYSFDTLQISSRFPNLTQLSLEAKIFTYQFSSQSFPTTLKSLRIQHSGQNSLPAISGVTNLPKLTILDVTPPATSLFQTINAPSLHQLLLQGPSKTATVTPTLPTNPRIRLRNVKYLEFHNWLDPSHISGVVSCDAVATLREWILQMPNVTKLKFVDSHVDGASLIDVVKSWNSGGTPKVGEITIDHCTGITRRECEDLMTLVDKVEVFV